MGTGVIRSGLTACALLALCTRVAGGFAAPVLLGPEVSEARGVRLKVDAGLNAFVGFEGNDGTGLTAIFYGHSLGSFASLERIGVDGLACRAPALTLGQLGVVHVLFEAGEGAARQIYAATNSGGPFRDPAPLVAPDALSRHRPAVWVDRSARRIAAWEERDGVASRLMLMVGDDAPESLAQGAANVYGCVSAHTGELHLLYTAGGTLFYKAAGRAPTSVATGVSSEARCDIVLSGPHAVPHMAYTTSAGVWYVRGTGSGLSAPELLASGARAPALGVAPSGSVTCAYLAWGDVWARRDDGAGFGAAVRLISTAQEETDLAMTVDQSGFMHLVTVRGGQAWYQNDIPAPVGAFSVGTVEGEVPLTVAFTDACTGGPVRTRLWDFGDGTTSVARDPVHEYLQPGVYTVTLTVFGPGGTDTVTVVDAVSVIPRRNHLQIPEIAVWPGQGGVRHAVLAMHPEHLQGCQLALVFRDTHVRAFNVVLDGTNLGSLQPEFIATQITDGSDGDKHLVFGAILDVSPPFDGRTVPPSRVLRPLVYIKYDVSMQAPLGTRLPFELRDGIGDPPLRNVFTVAGGISAHPALAGGHAMVVPRPACPFLRGDCNSDGDINVADAIFLLAYLFARAQAPLCFDACDANDSNYLDIGDAIFLLGFLFAQGMPPAYPYPLKGADPTADEFPTCVCP